MGEEELYEIARHNIKYKKRAGWSSVIGVVAFLFIFSYWFMDTTLIWPWFVMVPGLIATLFLPYYFANKMIGNKKGPVVEEMKRLKKDSNLDLSETETLKLKELRRNYKDEDFV